MEPITTIALLVGLAGIPTTLRPKWDSERLTDFPMTLSTATPHYLTIDVAATVTPPLSFSGQLGLHPNFGGEQDVLSVLSTYSSLSAGWDGPESVAPHPRDLERASAFVQSIPSAIPLPRPMLSASGVVGLFWDSGAIYSDVHFENDETISIYIRDRESGAEQFFDEVAIENASPDWYFEVFGALNHSYALAA